MSAPATLAPPRRLTLDEFLAYGEPDRRYELVKGIPVEMPPPTTFHQVLIAVVMHLFSRAIARQGLPYEVVALAVQTEAATVRIPDVLVVERTVVEPGIREDTGSGIVWLEMATPVVAVEVVSTNWRDDYVDKVVEYARRGIGEYVIVDARKEQITVHRQPVAGVYGVVEVYGRGEVFGLEGLGGARFEVTPILEGKTAGELVREEVEQLAAAEAQAEGERRAKEAEHQARLEAEARAEAERQAKEAERQAKEAERRAKKAERRAKEAERRARLAAEARAEAERQAKEAERQARLEAEAKLQAAEAELARLRAQRPPSPNEPT